MKNSKKKPTGSYQLPGKKESEKIRFDSDISPNWLFRGNRKKPSNPMAVRTYSGK